jgi:monoamine oxidase
MQKYDIVIFGGGIAGLTTAHELLKYNLKIAIVEKENILCSAIVRMSDKSKVSFTYTNRNGQGIQIKYLMGTKFEYICYNGALIRTDHLEHYKAKSSFQDMFSRFKIT